jgi:hypothetical protein
MNVNEKGNIGLIEVIRDLSKKGYECFIPFHDYSAVDLLAMDKNYAVRKIQIKYRDFTKGIIDIQLCSVVNGKRIPINRSAIDGWAIYIPSVDQVCYVASRDIPENATSFRIRKDPGQKTINVDKQAARLYIELTSVEVIW